MQLNFEQPEFSKNLFPGYMGIPILLPLYLTTRYFHVNFPANMLLVKLPNTSTRGFLSM